MFILFLSDLNIKGVSVDFYNRDDDILDPFSHLHSEEERLVSEIPLQVSQDAMLLNIREAFSQSKPGRTNEKASELSVSLFDSYKVTPRPVTVFTISPLTLCKHQLSLLTFGVTCKFAYLTRNMEINKTCLLKGKHYHEINIIISDRYLSLPETWEIWSCPISSNISIQKME